ncbi:MAG: glycosyl transferase [Hydrogenophaga sp.]|uniref:glycosyltransferase family 9 protein n=1 Tax=Hydrogenophaga sp. TaxID=1904254 RepID=UPI001698370A|nr:glycosyltransferase family 9 protein [Hydrogenophaga sp.]NIM41111.1 glycosyl transferase [Hydrogenophaga sp.]NIN26427.1 glycosyl transferase [Hydrogenophaga sp.]NIN31302.1 glycosyl transferase [Hydrogenophaga sp.]NIN55357.1 glycosyl transferase [Hydrogenophaga sp.]NIO51692.1 glycosyl transferase [Hydrogenophaga sp.]
MALTLIQGHVPATPRWADARRILAVRLDNLGDVLMTAPALAALKRRTAGTQLTLLTSPAGAELARHLDAVDECFVYRAPWTRQPEGTEASAAQDLRLVERLRAHRFDAAVIFTVCTQSALPAALLCRLAGIPLRLAHARENPYALLSDWVPETDVCASGMRHEVQRQLDLVRSVGYVSGDEALPFELDPADTQTMRAALAAAGGRPDRPWLVVHPGASAASRRYPAQRFGQAADALARATDCQIVFTGTAGEQPLVHEAGAAMSEPFVDLCGRLDLGPLAALIGGARALLCNNSGPAHLAAALGTPVVVLYALTNPQHTPWRAKARVLSHDVPCRHCLKSVCPQGHHDCLRRIEVHTVVDAVRELLERPDGEPFAAAPPLPTLPLQEARA